MSRPQPSGPRWTPAEISTLRATYTRGGGTLAARSLPSKSRNAIKSKANKLRLNAPAWTRNDRKSWPADDEIDTALRAACANGPPIPGTYARLSERFGRPSWYMSRRATALNLDAGPLRRAWTEDELQILDETAHLTRQHAAQVLRERGYERTPVAVELQRRLRAVMPGDGGKHNMSGLARMLGCTHVPIQNAIRAKLLRATLVQSGNGSPNESRYSIDERDIRRWIVENPYAVDLRKLPRESQAWLVGVITGER